ncbi:MAG: hypothetical protein ABSB74_14950 [Tepidisphaeraceae bacterium]
METQQFMKRRLIVISLLLVAGCSSKLETGYEPKRLDMPLGQRETLYADPYSQQAMQAQQEQGSGGGGGGGGVHRPGSP